MHICTFAYFILTALYCTVLYCTVLYCYALNYSEVFYDIQLFTFLLFSFPGCTALHCTHYHSHSMSYSISQQTYPPLHRFLQCAQATVQGLEEYVRPLFLSSLQSLITEGGVNINNIDKNNRQQFVKNLRQFVLTVRPLVQYH